MKPASGVHLLIYVHCVCNQVRGTVHGLLSDGTDQETVHVSGDRDRCVTEQLLHYRNVSTGGQHQRRGPVPQRHGR